MHILACFDLLRLRQELPSLEALICGLRDEGCIMTVVIPDALPDELAHVRENGLGGDDVYSVPLPLPFWQRRARGRSLGEKLGRTPPDLVWAFGEETHSLAMVLAETLACPAALSIWSLRSARRASPRQRHVGAWIAASPTLAATIGGRIGEELVECIQPAITGQAATPDPVGLAPSIAILDTGDDKEAMCSLLSGLGPVVAAVPELHVCLELAGPAGHAAWQVADAEGLLDHVSTVSDAARVRNLITRCDVLVQPGRSADARTLVLDAMANQRTIACAPAPHLDWLIDGETARFVPPTDPEAWSSALLELLHDPRQRQQLGEAALDRTDSHHGLESTVVAYLETFQRTCKGMSYPFAAQGTT